jgi:hypothetical protein
MHSGFDGVVGQAGGKHSHRGKKQGGRQPPARDLDDNQNDKRRRDDPAVAQVGDE